MKQKYTPSEFAHALGVKPERVRQWASRGLIKSVHVHPPVEYSLNDLTRMAVLCALAEVFERPVEFVDQNPGEVHHVSALIEGGPGGMDIVLKAPSCEVRLRPAIVSAIRERLAQVA